MLQGIRVCEFYAVTVLPVRERDGRAGNVQGIRDDEIGCDGDRSRWCGVSRCPANSRYNGGGWISGGRRDGGPRQSGSVHRTAAQHPATLQSLNQYRRELGRNRSDWTAALLSLLLSQGALDQSTIQIP